MPWIDALFKRMVEIGASDLHMTSGSKPQFRLHGDIVPITECTAIRPEQMRQILYEVTPGTNRQEFEDTNDTDFAYQIECLTRRGPFVPGHPWRPGHDRRGWPLTRKPLGANHQLTTRIVRCALLVFFAS
jgi:hypothetical protein